MIQIRESSANLSIAIRESASSVAGPQPAPTKTTGSADWAGEADWAVACMSNVNTIRPNTVARIPCATSQPAAVVGEFIRPPSARPITFDGPWTGHRTGYLKILPCPVPTGQVLSLSGQISRLRVPGDLFAVGRQSTPTERVPSSSLEPRTWTENLNREPATAHPSSPPLQPVASPCPSRSQSP